ncbi:uncharacterized protein LOC114574363 [Exaiptasia diaphana]|uniref:Uncharacterized protein n=1 Tax=Exaiptasia diaphana TaxID=2652724 RepID=A0A913YBT7_EXADI|nr:uncharacterized protein LOC114574363 [Exaiptasia diaphana]
MMKLLILLVALSSWLTLGLPSNGMIQQDSSKKGDGDILNHSICSHLREKDMCKRSHHVKKKLCKATCGCHDMISQKSCIVLKRFNECSKNLAMRMSSGNRPILALFYNPILAPTHMASCPIFG